MSKKSISIVFVAAALLAFTPCAEAKELKKDFHETFEVDKGDRLRLKHGDGDVVIWPSDRDVVDVTVHYHAEYMAVGTVGKHDFDVEFKKSDSVIYIAERQETAEFSMFKYLNVHAYTYTIHAPDYLGLDLDGEDGDVRIEAWRGEIECELDGGDLHLYKTKAPEARITVEDGDVSIKDFQGKLSLKVEDGDIEVSDFKTELCSIQTEDGDVRISRGQGDFTIEGEDGDVTLREVRARILNVRTEDGDIRLDLLKESEVDFNIRSEDGSVRITLDPGISAAYSIEVDDGSMKVDLPGAVKIEEGSNLITGEIGGGKGRIKIRTEDGSVTLRATK